MALKCPVCKKYSFTFNPCAFLLLSVTHVHRTNSNHTCNSNYTLSSNTFPCLSFNAIHVSPVFFSTRPWKLKDKNMLHWHKTLSKLKFALNLMKIDK